MNFKYPSPLNHLFIMHKDYYAILGISSSASQEEIQKAYERMMAASDRSSKSLEIKVDIEEAYFVLSNRQTRSQYDKICSNAASLAKNFDGFDSSKTIQGNFIGTAGPSDQTASAKNIFGDLNIDLEDPEEMLPENFAEIFQSAIKNIFHAADQAKDGGDIFLDLPVSVQKVKKGGYLPLEYQRYIHCSLCGQSDLRRLDNKKLMEAPSCPKCAGTGRVMAFRRVEVKIPKNVSDGAVLQIANEGHAPAGNLFVKIVFRDDSS